MARCQRSVVRHNKNPGLSCGPGELGSPRGAWVEFRTTDVSALQARLRRAQVPEFSHEGSSHVYFVAPGGQVFRTLDVNYVGP